MKTVNKNGKLYVNDMDVEALISNRKYMISNIDSIIYDIKFTLENAKLSKEEIIRFKAQLDVYKKVRQLFNIQK